MQQATRAEVKGASDRNRKEGGGVVMDGGKGGGWRGRGEAEGGVNEVCTRLSAPGVSSGPGSGVRKG